VVPIVVGSVLAALIVIVLIAYYVARRRSANRTVKYVSHQNH
jgi:hypothetical protein